MNSRWVLMFVVVGGLTSATESDPDVSSTTSTTTPTTNSTSQTSDDEQIISQFSVTVEDAVKKSLKLPKLDKKSQAALEQLDIMWEDNYQEASQEASQDAGGERGSISRPSLGDTPSSWPGHGKQFGSVGELATPVEISEGVPRPVSFINKYVIKRLPVLLPGAIAMSPGIKTWDTLFLSNAPPGVLTNVSVYDGSVSSLARTSMTLRQFVKDQNEALLLLSDIPAFLQKDVVFPKPLKCDTLLEQLTTHSLLYYKSQTLTETVRLPVDALHCAVRGKRSAILVPSAHWEAKAIQQETIDYSSVNYLTHPWLRELEFHNATIVPGDCLYVPNTWYIHHAYTEAPSISVIFYWVPEVTKVSRSSCGDYKLEADESLTSYSSLFSKSKKERDPMKDALIHYFIFYLGEQLSSSFTVKQFIRKIRRDGQLFKKMVSWNNDYEEISLELFSSLDVNKDGMFCLHDVIGLTDERRDELASHITDRLHDFGDVMEGQQKELKKQQEMEKAKQQQSSATHKTAGSQKPNSKMSGDQDDIASQFEEELRKEMDKMLKDLDLENAKAKGKANNHEEKKESRSKSGEKRDSRSRSGSEKTGDPVTSDDHKKDDKTKRAGKEKDNKKDEEETIPESYMVVEDQVEEILAEEEEQMSGDDPRGRTNLVTPSPSSASKNPKSESEPTPLHSTSTKTTGHDPSTVKQDPSASDRESLPDQPLHREEL